jgi:hypothetical protein
VSAPRVATHRQHTARDQVCSSLPEKASHTTIPRNLELYKDRLKPGTGKFKDASITYTSVKEVRTKELARWLKKSQEIQWDYKNIYKTKGKLKRIK